MTSHSAHPGEGRDPDHMASTQPDGPQVRTSQRLRLFIWIPAFAGMSGKGAAHD